MGPADLIAIVRCSEGEFLSALAERKCSAHSSAASAPVARYDRAALAQPAMMLIFLNGRWFAGLDTASEGRQLLALVIRLMRVSLGNGA